MDPDQDESMDIYFLVHHWKTGCTLVLFHSVAAPEKADQRHQMIRKLHHLSIPPVLIHWVHSFLSHRPQMVRVGTSSSFTIITNTGPPQGCVLSLFLFTLYTTDCTSPSPVTTYIKYSNDTPILALLNENNSVLSYQDSISHFSQWCTNNHLELHVKKTKEQGPYLQSIFSYR